MIWTDVFQCISMMSGMLVIMIKVLYVCSVAVISLRRSLLNYTRVNYRLCGSAALSVKTTSGFKRK